MPRVIVASKNPVKINAVKQAFAAMLPDGGHMFEGVSVASGVPDQPFSDAETLRGAQNRASNAQGVAPDADFWVGIEGGCEAKNGDIETFAWIIIRSKDGMVGKGRTGTFFLPPAITKLLAEGKELGVADDIVFGRSNSKHGNGTVGVLTADAIDRTAYYMHAVTLALIPFRNEPLYR